jgi:hypothetical protein
MMTAWDPSSVDPPTKREEKQQQQKHHVIIRLREICKSSSALTSAHLPPPLSLWILRYARHITFQVFHRTAEISHVSDE